MLACSVENDILQLPQVEHNCHVCPLCLKKTVAYLWHEWQWHYTTNDMTSCSVPHYYMFVLMPAQSLSLKLDSLSLSLDIKSLSLSSSLKSLTTTLIFTNVIKWIMIYYDTNIYAGSIIKIKMWKSHAFYRVQCNVLMHARRSYVSVTTFFHSSEALPCSALQVTWSTCAHEYVQVRRKHLLVERP